MEVKDARKFDVFLVPVSESGGGSVALSTNSRFFQPIGYHL